MEACCNTGVVIEFPRYAGLRCLMMPYIQGDPDSVPREYAAYADIIRSVYVVPGDVGYLTIDESIAVEGRPHRGARAKHGRALHTEAGLIPDRSGYQWGGGGTWGGKPHVTLDRDVSILLANSLDESCAVWDATCEETTIDGDIGHEAAKYPYSDARFMRAGEVWKIGIFTPHESLRVHQTTERQFLRIVSSGVHGREPYFTENPLLPLESVAGGG